MKSVDDLSKKEIVELLSKCWITHDGMWFYQTMQALGINETNRLNKGAIAMMVPMEIARIKKAFGINKKKIETFEELAEFFEQASTLFIPGFMNVTFSFPKENTVRWECGSDGCFAYKGISSSGFIESYECAVIHRAFCWLDALGVEYTTPEVSRCLMIDGGTCSGEIEVVFPAGDE